MPQGSMDDMPIEMDEGIGSMMEDPREMAADGGIMGSNAGSMLVTPTKDGSRPGYYGPDFGHTNDPGTNFGRDSYGDGPTSVDFGGESGGTDAQFERARKTQETAKQEAKIAKEKEKARVELEKKLAREKKEKEAEETEQTRNFFQKFVDKRKKAYLQGIEKKMYEDDMSLEDYEEEDFAKGFGGNYGKIQGAIKSAEEGTLTQSEFEKFMPGGIYSDKPAPVIPLGGGGGGGGQQTQQPATPPATPPPGGGLPDIPTDFVDLSGTQSYTNPAFAGQYFYGTPTITLANP